MVIENLIEKLDAIRELVGWDGLFTALAIDVNDRQLGLRDTLIPYIETVMSSGTDAEKLAVLADFFGSYKSLEARRANMAVYQSRLASLVGGLLNDEPAAPMGDLETLPD